MRLHKEYGMCACQLVSSSASSYGTGSPATAVAPVDTGLSVEPVAASLQLDEALTSLPINVPVSQPVISTNEMSVWPDVSKKKKKKKKK